MLPLLIAAIAIGVLGTAFSAYSSIQQGQAMSRQSAFNALVARRNAELAADKAEMIRTATDLQAKQHQRETKSLLASQEAGYAKAGVQMEGTPIYTAAETQRRADINELAIRYSGSIEASAALAEQAKQEQMAMLFKMQGSQARTAGYLQGGSSLLTGLSNSYLNYRAVR